MNNITFKNLEIKPDIMTCFVDGSDIKLTKKEYNLLMYLINERNKVFSRDEISNAVWNKQFSGRTVDATISRLRRKLGEPGKNIVTKNGFGYGFIEE